MEKETKTNTNVEMISDVIKNGVEAGIKLAHRHYHMITDLQQLILEKEKIFKVLGEQVFQLIDQGRIFAPALVLATFKTAKEILERISHLEEEEREKKESIQPVKEKKVQQKGSKEKESIVKKIASSKVSSSNKKVSVKKNVSNKVVMKKKAKK